MSQTGEQTAASGAYRAGMVTLVGRANVGKSSLVNAMAGDKISIVSDKPQTTRGPVRGILTRPGAQAVFIDTPGLHKPRTMLGQRLNRTAIGSLDGADVTVFVIDGRSGAGGGDRFVLEQLPVRQVCVVNKIDGMPRQAILQQLATVGEWGFEEYFAVSARSGRGVPELVGTILARLPQGPALYPEHYGRDMDDAQWVAELVREQLLAVARQELPYSIACRVTDWDWPYIKCEVLVERDSQKGIVIGHGGEVLKRAGSAVRAQLPPGAYLELSVRVARDWQQKPDMLDRLGI
ncbi:MAG TPA: GTPase Era [Acidimicrobiales bacterium]|nr:GTPase Era [Acidimicrobiales bacterium]